MVSVKVASFVGAVALFASAAQMVQRAHAADLPQLPPVYAPPIEEYIASGWYLRGDIGMSNQQVKSLNNALYSQVSSVNTVQKDFDSAPFFGLGVGYQFNHWFRADLTGEYRGKANFHGLDIVRSGVNTFTDEYRGSKSEWLVLANFYVDLGTWYSFTPFVGAGIGASYNTISNFLDVCTTCAGGGVATGDTASKWNFAWALHAGVAYKVNSQLTIEFAYRYVSLGDAMSGDLVTFTGTNNINNPMEFNKISSHDLKLGVRWLLDAPVEKGPVMLPPLRSRG
jgi:opacity protein-like surface antigen